MKGYRGGSRGRGHGAPTGTSDRIDTLGRLLVHILRHDATELNLDMRSDGYVKLQDILKLNMKTLSNIPLSSYAIDEIREAVRIDNKQRLSLMEEDGELWVRANQGFGRDVNMIIFLDTKKAMEDGIKFYRSENGVILTEGLDGVVPAKYFQKIESWPKRNMVTFHV